MNKSQRIIFHIKNGHKFIKILFSLKNKDMTKATYLIKILIYTNNKIFLLKPSALPAWESFEQ